MRMTWLFILCLVGWAPAGAAEAGGEVDEAQETALQQVPQMPPGDVVGSWTEEGFLIEWRPPRPQEGTELVQMVVREPTPAGPVDVARLPADATEHTVADAAPADHRTFYVVAMNSADHESPPSTPVGPIPYPYCPPLEFTPLPPPPFVGGPYPSCVVPRQETVDWLVQRVEELIP